MSLTHSGWLPHRHSHCSVAVYLLFFVVQSDLSPEIETFPSSVCVPLGVHASLGNALMEE